MQSRGGVRAHLNKGAEVSVSGGMRSRRTPPHQMNMKIIIGIGFLVYAFWRLHRKLRMLDEEQRVHSSALYWLSERIAKFEK